MEQIYSACCTTLLIYSSVSRRKEDTNTTLHSRCSSFFFFYFAVIWDIPVHMCACVCVRQYGFNVNAPCASALAHYHFPKTWLYIFCSFFFQCLFFSLVSYLRFLLFSHRTPFQAAAEACG